MRDSALQNAHSLFIFSEIVETRRTEAKQISAIQCVLFSLSSIFHVNSTFVFLENALVLLPQHWKPKNTNV